MLLYTAVVDLNLPAGQNQASNSGGNITVKLEAIRPVARKHSPLG
jgi:hypothetical protein